MRIWEGFSQRNVEDMIRAHVEETGSDWETARRRVEACILSERPYVPLIRAPQPDKFPIRIAALQLAAVKDRRIDPLGSAVMIAPRLALTAAHVIADYARKFDGHDPQHGVAFRFNVLAMQTFADAQVTWTVVNTMTATFADFTLLSLAPLRDEPESEMRFVTPME